MNKGGNYTSYLSENVILNALQTDINPMTKTPYFPAAICSRLSTGNVIMFNHLRPNHLLNIIENAIQGFADGFYNKYRVTLSFSKDIPFALLFRYCGLSDARKISEKTRSFLADEIHKMLRLWYAGNLENETKTLINIAFSVSKNDIEPEAEELFTQTGSAEILVITDEQEFEQLLQNNVHIKLFNAKNKEEAFELIAAHDFLCVILDPAVNISNDDNMNHLQHTSYNRTPLESGIFECGNAVFRAIRERFPELPVYIYETEKVFLNEDLMISYITEGAMGKLSVLSASFNDEFESIVTSLSIQEKIADMASRQKILYFESVPEISSDKKTLDIRLKSLSLRQNISADDMHAVADINEHKSLTFDDVIGADEVKDEMRQMLDFIKKPQKWRATGLPLPKGILLYGPPGTGKTMLAKALASEAGVPFLSETASNFVKIYAGTGPASVRKLFERAREYAPSIIFIDEIDAIGRKRTGGNSQHEHEMALNALLTEMDGFHNNRKRPVLVIAATNYGGNNMDLDAALLRRFDRRIFVDLPNLEERSVFLHRAVKALLPEISIKDIELIAKRSNGMSLANLESVVSLAIRNSAKRETPFSIELLEEALEIESCGKEVKNHSLKRTAIHEAGHALVSICLNKNPLYITIVSRDGSLGYVQNDTSEAGIQTRTEYMEQISILLAGRAAEILFCEGGSSSGASSDLQRATHIALRLICSYGMDESFGMAVIGGGNEFSGPFADKIHDKVSSMLEECLDTAKKLLTEHKDTLDSLVEQLLDKRKLNADDIKRICTH